MKIYLGADHRGFDLKEKLKQWLVDMGHDVKDMGAHVMAPGDDYTDYASAVGFNVAKTQESRGVVFCGSGVGVDVVANKIDGIRCAYAASVDEVKSAREDDDSNVLAVAADYTDVEHAKEFVKAFLDTAFKRKEKYERRIDKIRKIEHMN